MWADWSNYFENVKRLKFPNRYICPSRIFLGKSHFVSRKYFCGLYGFDIEKAAVGRREVMS